MHFFSRSRDEIWRKGETSGATMAVKQLRYDCDGDAVLAIVAPAGPACHTGARTCFHREIGGAAAPDKDAPPARGEPHRVVHEALPDLRAHARECASAERPDGSYTVELLDDPPHHRGQGARRRPRRSPAPPARRPTTASTNEAADVLYHLLGPAGRSQRADPLRSSRCSMAVRASQSFWACGRTLMASDALKPAALDQAEVRLEPTLEEARAARRRRQRRAASAPQLHRRHSRRPWRRSSSSGATTRPIPTRAGCLPARERGAGPALRALLVHRPAPARRCCAGVTASSANGPADPLRSAASRPRSSPSPTPTAPSPSASPPTSRPRSPTCRPSRAGPSASSATTSCARSSRRSARPTRTSSGCRTWRSCSPTSMRRLRPPASTS